MLYGEFITQAEIFSKKTIHVIAKHAEDYNTLANFFCISFKVLSKYGFFFVIEAIGHSTAPPKQN